MSYPTSLANSACLYLHGFLSSPASEKAQELIAHFEQHSELGSLHVPQLPFAPSEAQALITDLVSSLTAKYQHVWLIGSSLGGFYATWAAQQFHLPAVLVNPAVRPFELFEHYLGPHTHFHSGVIHILEPKHLVELASMHSDTIKYPESLLLLLQTGDETLDYRHAAELYRGCPSWIEGAGDHRFQQFIPRVEVMVHHVARCIAKA
ncbi:MAG: esterase [Oleibacter sp.]|nr:esterase [Thalassolituus sp.]